MLYYRGKLIIVITITKDRSVFVPDRFASFYFIAMSTLTELSLFDIWGNVIDGQEVNIHVQKSYTTSISQIE